jgi:hypothetical protein
VITAAQALASIPAGLREPLLAEYRSIVQNYLERRWSPSELSGGRFCEIVFTILEGHAKGTYAAAPYKPTNFVGSCRALEGNAQVPRSFQILIPRLLPALYEIRNNRGVGHVGGDVDPNYMDAAAVLSMANWVMAELVRVLHGTAIEEAQAVVDGLAERRVPLLWQSPTVKRVLDPELSLKDQLLLLINSEPTGVALSDLLSWSGYKSRPYFLRLLRQMHSQRLVEMSSDEKQVHCLPPGSLYVEKLVASRVQRAG